MNEEKKTWCVARGVGYWIVEKGACWVCPDHRGFVREIFGFGWSAELAEVLRAAGQARGEFIVAGRFFRNSLGSRSDPRRKEFCERLAAILNEAAHG